MDEATQQILEQFDNYYSGDKERSEIAGTFLLEAVKHPQFIISYINIMKSDQKTSYKRLAAVLLRRLIFLYINSNDYSIDELNMIYQELIIIFQNDPNSVIKCSVCDIISLLSLDENGDNIYNFFIPVLNDYLAKNIYLDSVFYAYSEIFLQFDDEKKCELADFLFDYCLAALENGNIQTRINALTLLNKFVPRIDEPLTEKFNTCSDLAITINNMTSKLLAPDSDPNEANTFFNLVSDIIFSSCQCFENYHVKYAEFLGSSIIDENIDQLVRKSSLIALESLFEVSIDSLDEIIVDIMNNVILFSVELCRDGPDSDDIDVFTQLFDQILEEKEQDEIFDMFYPIIEEFLKSEESYTVKVGFELFCDVITKCYDVVPSIKEEIISFMVYGLGLDESQNSFVIASVCKCIVSLCNAIPEDMHDTIDILVNNLVPKLYFLPVANALKTVISVSTEPPANANEILKHLLESVLGSTKEYQECLIEIINGIIENVKSLEEGFYEEYKVVLIPLLEGDSMQKGSAINGFKSLATLAPQSFLNDFKQLLSLFVGFSAENDWQLNTAVCDFIAETCTSYSNTQSEYVSELVPLICDIRNLPMIDTENDEEEDDDEKENLLYNQYNEMKSIALNTLATLFSYLPELMQVNLEQISKFCFSDLDSAIDSVRNTACASLLLMAKGYEKINADPSPIISALLQAASCNEVEFLSVLWDYIYYILLIFGRDLILKHIDSINTLLNNIFCRNKKVYIEKGNANEINSILQKPVFNVLGLLIKELNMDFQGMIDNYMESLYIFLKSKNIIRVRAALAIAQIALYIPNHNSELQAALEIAFDSLKRNGSEYKTYALRIISLTIQIDANGMLQYFEEINGYVSSIIQRIVLEEKENLDLVKVAVCLYLAMHVKYGLQVTQVSFLNEIEFENNSEELIMVSEFVAYCHQNYPEAIIPYITKISINVLTSDYNILREIPRSILELFANSIRQVNPENLREMICYQESYYEKIQKNISDLDQ